MRVLTRSGLALLALGILSINTGHASNQVDINGDGRGDVIQTWNNNGVLWLLPYTSNGSTITPLSWVNTGQGYNSGPRNGPGLLPIDINGDGKTDLIQQWNNKGVLWILVYISNGTGFTWTSWINTQQPYATATDGTPGLIAMDVDGDGRSDLLQQWNNNGTLYLKIFPSSGAWFDTAQPWINTNNGFDSTGRASPGLIALDINGDGKIDLLQQWNNNGVLWLLPYLSNGSTFVATHWFNTTSNYGSGPQGTPGLIAMDVNGDGRTDLVQQWDNNGRLWLLPIISTESGFVPTSWYNTGNNFKTGPQGSPGLISLDVNGDGKADLVQQFNNPDGTLGLATYLSDYAIGGSGSFLATGIGGTGQGYASGPGGNPGLRALDIDGDNKTDLIQQWNNQGTLWVLPYLSNGSNLFPARWINTNQGYASTSNATPGLIAGRYTNPIFDELSAHVVVGEQTSSSPIAHEQTVYSYDGNSCNDPYAIADTPARAFRDSTGQIQMVMANENHNRRLIGPWVRGQSFNLTLDCSTALLNSNAANQADPNLHRDQEWLHTVYFDSASKNVYALIHNEYHGWNYYPTWCDHSAPQPIGPAEMDTCWKTATTFAFSTDGGKTYSHPKDAAGNLGVYDVAWPAYTYNRSAVDPGLSEPTNIIRNDKDGYYYAMVWAWVVDSASSPAQKKGVCLMRSAHLSDPTSWRAWDGNGFNVSFYPAGASCTPVGAGVISAGVMPTHLSYNMFLGKFMLVGNNDAVYFYLSDDLIHWSAPTRIDGLIWPLSNDSTTPIRKAYAVIFDPSDSSANFERPGKNVDLYFTRMNQGTSSMNRDLVRIQITFENAQ